MKISNLFIKGVLIKKILIIVGFFVYAIIITNGIGIYYLGAQNKISGTIGKIIPYPVAIIDGKIITYSEWFDSYYSLYTFYKTEKKSNETFEIPKNDITEKNVTKRILEQKITEKIAKNYNIEVATEEINREIDLLVEEVGDYNSFEKQLQKLYGMNIERFKKEIIYPYILREKVSFAVKTDNELNSESFTKIKMIEDKIKNGELTFENAAQQYSEDVSASQGGDIGYFKKNEMIPQFENVAFELNKGAVSEVIKTPLGYHLILVTDKIVDEDGAVEKVKASHILISGLDFEQYMEEQKNNSFIYVFIGK